MASRGLGSIGSKKLMDFNDSLRECNLHRYGIGIPQIAVVGQQSSGKSSVLEAITGVPFPRDSALCTRGPMEVRIKSCDSKEEERIQVWAEHTAKRDPIFLAGKNSTAQLEGCMRAVIDTLMAEEKQSSFTDKVAYVEIHKMHEPPLTVIDLPGYFQAHSENDSKDKADVAKVHAINQRYIENENTILLHIIPGDTDPATLVSWMICNRHDRQHSRTIGVITKIDKADIDQRQAWLKRILGAGEEKYTLPLGYYVLRCRTTEERRHKVTAADLETLEDALIKSLKKAAHESELQLKEVELSKHLGKKTVVDALSESLLRNIKDSLPKIHGKVLKALEETKEELARLGLAPDSNSVRRELFTKATKNIVGKLGTKKGGVVVPLNDPTQLSVTRMQFLAAGKLVEDIRAITMEFQDSDFTSPEIKLSIPPIRKRSAPDEERMRQVLKKMFSNKLREGLPGHQDMDVYLSDEEESDGRAKMMSNEHTGESNNGSATNATHKRKHSALSNPDDAKVIAARTKESLTRSIRQKKEHPIHGFNDFELFKSLLAALVERSTKKIQTYLKRTTAIVEYVLHNAYTEPAKAKTEPVNVKTEPVNAKNEPLYKEGSATASLQRALFRTAMEVYDKKRQLLLEETRKICESEMFPNSASVPAAGTAEVLFHNGPPPTPAPTDPAATEADHLLRLIEKYWGTVARNRLVDVVTSANRRNWHELLDTEIEARLANVTDDKLEEMMKESEAIRDARGILNRNVKELEEAVTLINEVL